MKKINPELSATPWTGGTLTDLMKEVEVSEVSDKTTKKPKKKKSKKSWSNY